MKIIKIFSIEYEKCLDVSLCSMISICSGVAVNAYLGGGITFSFGCEDSRKHAQISRDRLAVGIPVGLYNVFSDQIKMNNSR